MGSRSFVCPGRVNLIGEHIDYNGGMVLPAALDLNIKLTLEEREDEEIVLSSENVDYAERFNLKEDIVFNKNNRWTNYPKGVIKALIDKGFNISKGFNARYSSSIPLGSGLSSSAAMEVVTAYGICSLFNINLSKKDISVLCKSVENNFIGVNCGIMDQFAVAMGKKDNAIMLNCDTLEFNYVPMNLRDYRFIIVNTNKPRELIKSEYNTRLRECNEGLLILKEKLSINTLCELTVDKFKEYSYLIKNHNILKRLTHVISENHRVSLAKAALSNGFIEDFGQLMVKSHISLRDNYEVTGLELDTIFQEALKVKGCIGSRMTGAGFGGCNISLVHKDNSEEFKDKVSKGYKSTTGLNCDFYICNINNGVREVL